MPGVACLQTWTHVVVAMVLPAQIWPPFRCGPMDAMDLDGSG